MWKLKKQFKEKIVPCKKYYFHKPSGTYWAKGRFETWEDLGILEADCEEITRQEFIKKLCNV